MSNLEWQEPVEGLEPGELLLGNIASSYLSRGRLPGYGFCFTDRRIIGVKMRLISRAVEVPVLAAIAAIYIIFLLESFSLQETPVLLLFPLVFPIADWLLRLVSRRLSDRIISRRGANASKMLTGKKDFELRREVIGEFLMKSPGKGWSLLTTGGTGGYLKITPKNYSQGLIEIKIHKREQHQRLRDLVIRFSSREPKVRAMEFT